MIQKKPLRLTETYMPTLKETPADAEVISHKLLLRSGMIRKTASGLYSFLPLGYKVLAKVRRIIEEEMDAIGAQEIVMPVLEPAELWMESGRWSAYGPELMRQVDRHEREFCLGPTHEEVVTALVRNELRSYKELPVTLYQIQVKYRDEIRPRFGVFRSREFLMKDAYSFHDSKESLQKTYDDMYEAYSTICKRLGLDFRPVEADAGQIGGSITCEFMALAEAGEDDLVHCTCGWAANTEVADCICTPTCYEADFEKVYTPGVHTIAELAEFLSIPESSTMKALSGKTGDGSIVVLFAPGDHEINEVKASHAVGGFELLTDEEMEEAGLHKGSMGPVGLPEGIRVIADKNLKTIEKWVVGANDDGYHFVGARPGVDFIVDEWADLSAAQVGDLCPKCGKPLGSARGIEVGHIFQLGDKYSKAMNATYMAEDGSENPFIMGCYGIGVSRAVGAVVEQHFDDNGISWPVSVAPAHVCVIPLSMKDSDVVQKAEEIADKLAGIGVEVVLDDRKDRPGVKFADADLIGWPFQIVVGSRDVKQGLVEFKERATGERKQVSFDEFDAKVTLLAKAAREGALEEALSEKFFA